MASKNSKDKRSKGSRITVLEIPEIDWNELYGEVNDPGETVREIAEKIGRSVSSIQTWVEREVEAGRLIKGKSMRENLAGRRCPLNVYRPVD